MLKTFIASALVLEDLQAVKWHGMKEQEAEHENSTGVAVEAANAAIAILQIAATPTTTTTAVPYDLNDNIPFDEQVATGQQQRFLS